MSASQSFYAIQHLRSARRRWEARENTPAQRPEERRVAVYRQCPACGNGNHRNGPSAGNGSTSCTRCRSSLIPRYPAIPGFSTVMTVTS
jgi:hypothetical protein